MKDITFLNNDVQPPFILDNDSIDFIYAISIFTHLSAINHKRWLEEIYRVLKPGGIFYFTTHGDITKIHLLPNELKIYNQDMIVEKNYHNEGNRLYCAYHPPTAIKNLIKSQFNILEHKPGIKQSWGYEQDVWIIQKK